jgi:hypothetical protein
MAQVVKCLLTKFKALEFKTPEPLKKRKEKKTQKGCA